MSNRFVSTLANILNKPNKKYSIKDISFNELSSNISVFYLNIYSHLSFIYFHKDC